jgi:hypothetical protein
MKKITPLVIALLFCVEFIVSQEITNSSSTEIVSGNSISCNTQGITRTNSFYRVFNPENYGIFTAYHINTFQFGIEKLVGAPNEGYPVVISIYSYNNNIVNFPTEGDLTLRGEVTEMLTDQSLTVHTTPIDAIIPANQKFLMKIFIPSDTADDGGNNNVQFEIGSNNAGELSPSYIQSEACSIISPITFESQGRSDIHVVMQVIGTSATAGIGQLESVDFSYLPNPVTDRLLIKAKENITSIQLYNLLGQEIKKFNPSQLEAELDLSLLKAGTYFIKVLVNNKTGTFKIVKI